MPNKCVVPGCNTGYLTCKVKLSTFSAPKDDKLREEWQTSLGLTKPLMAKHVICEKHFHTDQIIRSYKLKDESGNVLAEVLLKHARVATNAVPTILAVKKAEIPQPKTSNEENLQGDENVMDKQLHTIQASQTLTEISQSGKNQRSETCLSVFDQSREMPAMGNDFEIETGTDTENRTVLSIQETLIIGERNLFMELLENPSLIQTPPNWHFATAPSKKYIALYELHWNEDNEAVFASTRKSLIIGHDMKTHYMANGKSINPLVFTFPDKLYSLENLNKTLEKFASLSICVGIAMFDDVNLVKGKIGYTDNNNELRHNRCPIVIDKRQCEACKNVKKSISQKKLRMSKRLQIERRKTTLEHQTLPDVWKKKLRRQQCALKRAKTKIDILKKIMLSRQTEINELKKENVLKKCEDLGISDGQKMCIQEIMAAAQKKKPKGLRYTDEWVMLCILMHIRSPGAYEFLRKNGVLPLPCIGTIRRYLSIIDMKCGFDKNFFEVFEKHIRGKASLQKHGLLLVDEISLRESTSVATSDLTYKGLVDFGEDRKKAESVDQKAKTGLVFMFQPLADKYTQPIAVFASCGPVKGVELATLVTKALVLLENAGAVVHGIVSDGAETNRKMWGEFGVCGKMDNFKNWFMHPANDERKVFVFSDTPHLIKCVRNRLYSKQKQLRLDPNEPFVRWKHFETLYCADKSISATQLRMCPKLTLGHLELSNTSKMKVRLATQVFSNSIVHGLKFYKARGVPGLEDCDATIDFCQRLDDLFDALNRKTPNEGLTPNGNDFKILQSSLEWLNNWENNFRAGKIQQSDFLTSNTAEGLRVTIQSTMDICETLTAEHGFQYILTGRINQDSLEKFFGIIRQAAGANDHPSTPTFLQLYKLLSTYSILRPPTSGNCTVTETSHPKSLITVSELRSIYEKPTKTSMTDLKTRLDGLIEGTEWEFDDVVEHDYAHAPVVDCVIYYVTGYVCKQIEKHFDCEKCRKAMRAPAAFSQQCYAEIVNFKSRGALIHPNSGFFHMLCKLEAFFEKHVHSPNVYSETVSEMLENYKVSFPCQEHAQDLLSYAIKYYLRMRQYSQ